MEHDKLKFDNTFGQLKVIGIVCVLLRHAHWYFTIPDNGMIATLIPAVGELGVNIFLFASGFGLMISMDKHGYGKIEFWIRRVIKLYPLYLISLSCYVFFIEKIDLSNYLAHVILLHSFILKYTHSPNILWFMGVIFQLYFIFPFLYDVYRKNEKKFWILLFVLYILNNLVMFFINSQLSLSQKLESSPEDCSVFSFIFIIAFGFLYSLNLTSKKSILKLSMVVKIILCLTAAAFIFAGFYSLNFGYSYSFIYKFGKIVFPLLASLFIFYFIKISMRFNSGSLLTTEKLGRGIFCTYLFHEFVFSLISGTVSESAICLFLAIPIAVIAGALIQSLYDMVVYKIYQVMEHVHSS